ncbi:MAG TPA: hypothetical protein VI112_00840 [Bacteroidia bacterium]|jgi:hypothetical protein
MKKLFLSLIFFTPLLCLAQNEGGKLVGSAGAGLGIYHTYNTDLTNNTPSVKDTAGAWVFPLMVEYFPAFNGSLAGKFGIGGGFKYSNYIEGKDSSALGVNGFDLQIKPAFHFLNKKKIDMSVHALAGATYISYKSNDLDDVKGSGFGALFGGGLNMRIYFTDIFGMYIDYTYHSFTYNDIRISNTNGDHLDVKVKFNGGNVGLGLVFRLN